MKALVIIMLGVGVALTYMSIFNHPSIFTGFVGIVLIFGCIGYLHNGKKREC